MSDSNSNSNSGGVPANMNDFNKQVIEEFRANGGKVGGMFAGAPMMLLTTTGAKSGQPRIAPLVHTRDEKNNLVIIASKGGAPAHPDWYHNVVANPDVTVEVGSEKYPARARITSGDERARLFRAQADLMPNFDEYQKKTTREIPVIVLERTTK